MHIYCYLLLVLLDPLPLPHGYASGSVDLLVINSHYLRTPQRVWDTALLPTNCSTATGPEVRLISNKLQRGAKAEIHVHSAQYFTWSIHTEVTEVLKMLETYLHRRGGEK